METITKNEYTVTKSTVECYKLRHPTGMYWADIIIDANEKSGRIQIASDFGDWQNYWGSCGKPFKEFLIGLGIDYAATKFNASDYFDADHNIILLKKYVLELRRNEDLKKERARDIYNEIKEIQDECSNEATHFYSLVNNTKYLYSFYYDGFDVSKTITPGFKAFWKNVWPQFIDVLNSETPNP